MNTIILSAIFGVVMMFSGIFIHNRSAYKNISSAALLLLLVFNIFESQGSSLFNINTTNFLHFNKFGLLFNSICIFSTLIYVMLSGREIEKAGNNTAEAHALIFFVLCGIGIVTSYTNLLMLFIGIEILSIPLYILTGSDKKNLKGNEAALKYFLMGSFSTGIMLMGIAMLYGSGGTFMLENVVKNGIVSYLSALGMVLIFIALCFKVSAAPFHFWTPDVYDGAPAVITSFMATVVKVAGFAAFIRLIEGRLGSMGSQTDRLIAIVIILTLAFGNLTAVFQQSVKRMLAYSSIAQAGFMLFSLFAVNDAAKEGLLLYAAAYSLATIGIFAVLAKMDDMTLEGFNGLSKSQPLIAALLAIFLLSLAGIPLTAGFFAKFYMLSAVVKTGKYLGLVIIGVLFAAVSAYYYFKVIQAMYFKDGNVVLAPVTARFKYLLLFVAALIVVLGVYPNALLSFLYF
ncbi:NADH-quinone oxidoreductase subunit N [Segetibacter sp.]|jgi:NADH-quinone oxidoreductase subunit N|uniref:NADH-quinone oxidoreductase subunit N n=1 Tax=Segetibacter sp. TaxID=2231182 RepID=UPI002621C1F2|nr:NADH-quinone oxidoreductase subunit N [Segetibacter sp.]MCW3078741.1 NADH-ubiquinone oxidoreductase chain [Segetibacter sp.]